MPNSPRKPSWIRRRLLTRPRSAAGWPPRLQPSRRLQPQRPFQTVTTSRWPRHKPCRRPCRSGPELTPVVRGPHARSEELARLEAALFIAREPLPLRRLAKLARLADATRGRTLLRELNGLLDTAGAAFRVEHLAGGFQLLTRSQFGPWVRRTLEYPAENRLSNAALETLSIVAYRQPVTRPEIEAIRGVGSEEMLRQLLDRDLIAIGGRSEELGRPNVYITSRYFLRVFGLGRIEDLPACDLATDPTDS